MKALLVFWKKIWQKKQKEPANLWVLGYKSYGSFQIYCYFNHSHIFQTCFYCKRRGASIGCCKRGCRKSFHLPCAIKNNCLSQFVGSFDSFCHLHHGIDTPDSIHRSDVCCRICQEIMGIYHPVSSIELTCCNGGWCHKKCLMELAHSIGPRFACPLCDNDDDFNTKMLLNGIYIPVR